MVPFWISSAVSVQPIAGEQTVLPPWHGLVGEHMAPAAQATQAPPIQTFPLPHCEPLAAFPDSRHTGSPVLQVVVPVRQGLPGTTQADPATHATQAAVALQTKSFPHELPATRFVIVSTQAATPPVHVSPPLWQGLVGVQACPATHAVHTPDWHTMPVPQPVPSV
jgi:hypothetical protein